MQGPRLSLSQKLVIGLIGSLVLTFGALGYQNIRIHRRDLEEMTHMMADRISNTIKDSTRYSMLKNHRDEVYQIIRTIGAKQGIKTIRIFNKEGKIMYSTAVEEVGTYVNKQGEACYACHTQEQPLAQLDRPDRMRTYLGPGNERILGLINPIENEAACATAACHAHSPDQRILGVLDVSLSLAGVDQTIARGQRSMIGSFLVAMFLISALFSWLIWSQIHRPIRRLIRGTHQVAAGRFDSRIDFTSGDELGDLASSFDLMTVELKHAHEELTDWAKTLERRVEEKSAQLQQAHEQMLQVEKLASIGKLSAIVAHEINNPLAGILTYSKLLLKRIRSHPNIPDQMRLDLEMIATESARCGEIVKSLLQFARQTAPQLQARDINDLVRQSVRLVKHKLDLASVETRVRLDEHLPPLVCDEQQMKQALVALLINACEAVRPGEGILELETGLSAGGKSVQIRIRDNGIGMDKETQKQIFEPFFTTKEAKGMGLGLAVVLGIVSRHSGTIHVESSPGRGTTFVMELPLQLHPKGSEADSEERSVMVI